MMLSDKSVLGDHALARRRVLCDMGSRLSCASIMLRESTSRLSASCLPSSLPPWPQNPSKTSSSSSAYCGRSSPISSSSPGPPFVPSGRILPLKSSATSVHRCGTKSSSSPSHCGRSSQISASSSCPTSPKPFGPHGRTLPLKPFGTGSWQH
jgi:hypothetical protein